MRTRTLAARLLMLLGPLVLGPTLPAATPWTQTLTQQALSTGFLARLPPSVSGVLGLANASEGSEVRQLLSKEGHQVRTFNVTVAGHEVVIFDVNAQTGATAAYLVSSDGRPLKAASYQSGGEARLLGLEDAKSGFSREVRFWSARARHSPAATAPPSHQ
jgi:hypothetical protein